MAKTDTLVNILRLGAELVMKKGFQATGLNDILRAAGVPKGSFYHYFRNKEDFGLQLIDFYGGFLLARMEDHLDGGSLPPLARLRAFFLDFRREMEKEGFVGGSLVGNLAQEMAGQSPAFRERLRAVYGALNGQITKCLREAAGRGDIPYLSASEEMADFILGVWDGAVMRAKVEAGPAPLEWFDRFIFDETLGISA
jgi:TetR/AcrR family transcriptional repressor of nem operon